MPLRCLLFASDEATAQPLWRVITELGMEGEHCRNAVEAVERLTNHQFHIVIADWDDEPEASFLLKTARELKAAQRPLTLAIIRDEVTVPKALQAGANSVLRKPIVPGQVKDTLGTARDLLRAKLEPGAPKPQVLRANTAIAAAAAPAPAPEKGFRAGEFLQPAASGPSAQFDTQSELPNSFKNPPEAEGDTLSELEPMAATVKTAEPSREDPPQAQSKPRPADDTESPESHRGDLQAVCDGLDKSDPAISSAHLRRREKIAQPVVANSSVKLRKILLAVALVLTFGGAYLKVPHSLWRQNLHLLYASVVHSGHAWLNPQPAAPPQVAATHENFGQAGDEYKLPVPENIPDASTDPSQIHVLPVLDPTVKPPNGSSSGQSQSDPGNTDPTDQDPNGPIQPPQTPSGQVRVEENSATGMQVPSDNQPVVVPPGNGSGLSSPVASQPQQLTSNPSNTPAPSVRMPPPPAPQARLQGHPTSISTTAGIPRSLQSQSAGMTPAAGGTRPLEAAMPSIGPVDLPEATARALLAQQVEPIYPESARASRQHGTVILQVVIGPDGAVEDAKFLQGSLAFARPAIDAVRQWRFKPYLFNGRPTVARTTLTLSFKPTS